MLYRARQKYVESGDKARRLSASYIKRKRFTSAITAVQSRHGELTTKPSEINEMQTKILSRVLCSRLDKVITSLVHHNQVGFIRKRNSSDKVRHCSAEKRESEAVYQKSKLDV